MVGGTMQGKKNQIQYRGLIVSRSMPSASSRSPYLPFTIHLPFHKTQEVSKSKSTKVIKICRGLRLEGELYIVWIDCKAEYWT